MKHTMLFCGTSDWGATVRRQPCRCRGTHSDVHQWNRVYVDGAWRNVDVCALDACDDAARRAYQQILYAENEMQGSIYRQPLPALAKKCCFRVITQIKL